MNYPGQISRWNRRATMSGRSCLRGLIRERGPEDARPTGVTDSRLEAASRVEEFSLALAISGVGEASENIALGEVGKVGEKLFVSHARGKIFQDVIHRHPQAANAG